MLLFFLILGAHEIKFEIVHCIFQNVYTRTSWYVGRTTFTQKLNFVLKSIAQKFSEFKQGDDHHLFLKIQLISIYGITVNILFRTLKYKNYAD